MKLRMTFLASLTTGAMLMAGLALAQQQPRPSTPPSSRPGAPPSPTTPSQRPGPAAGQPNEQYRQALSMLEGNWNVVVRKMQGSRPGGTQTPSRTPGTMDRPNTPEQRPPTTPPGQQSPTGPGGRTSDQASVQAQPRTLQQPPGQQPQDDQAQEVRGTSRRTWILNQKILQEDVRTQPIGRVAQDDPARDRPNMNIRSNAEPDPQQPLPTQDRPAQPPAGSQPRPMQQNDRPYEGHGLFGFDPETGKFAHVWCDSTHSAIAYSIGTYDESARTFTFTVEESHGQFQQNAQPGGAGRNAQASPNVRVVVRIISDDQHVVQYFAPGTGQQAQQVMEITYTRAR